MPLFTLNEVKFQNEFDRDFGDQDNFDINSYRYPIDVGTAKYNHFMTFEVFVRDKINSDFGVETEGGDPVEYQIRKGLSQTRGTNLSTLGESISTTVSSAIGNKVTSSSESAATTSGSSSVSSNRGNSVPGARGTNYDVMKRYNQNNRGGGLTTEAGAGKGSLGRVAANLKKDIESTFNTLKRAKESITLYMPDTLNFDYSHQYDQLQLSQNPVVAAAQYGLAGLQAVASKGSSNFSPFILEALENVKPNAGTKGLSGFIGYAVNPQFEVIYSSTGLRQFQFDFMFYPRSESEAEQVHKIINSFKFHAAPEIVSGSFGRYLLAPSAFDIKFFYNGQINPNIPKISTCYCTSVQTDYAPNGFSTYEVQGENYPSVGKTGMPVAIRMQLQFMEGTMVTKELLRGKTLESLTTGGGSF